jgi:DNA-binding GntR family transcriptional regulator
MIEFRKIIEVGALEMSFDRLTASHLEELKELNRQAENISKSQDIKVHWEANQMFHRKLCSFCGNRYLQKSLDDSLNFCTRIANQYFIKVWESNEAEDGDHFKIVNSIENKNLEYAKEILIYDIELMKNKIL